MIEIHILDDEAVLADSLRLSLEHWGYAAKSFGDAASFFANLERNEPDILFLDLGLPDRDGMDVLGTLKESGRPITTVIITAHGNMSSAVQAMKLGAFDYVAKPFELDEIRLIVEKAIAERRLQREVAHRRERDYGAATLDAIIGDSPAMKTLLEQVRTIANVPDTTVLLRGESGTGKDLLAKAIHNLGNRAEKQFIEINCASFPESLIESELFGYEKGAFTDAKQRKTGLLELADGGTLFLDEIGELPLFLQAKLLKFIESKSFRRIGGAAEIPVDIRIISATNRNLEHEVETGGFRQDLFYRLNVVPLVVPPLRERTDDIIAIMEHYLAHFSRKFGKPPRTLAPDAEDALGRYPWPGNVRELKNLAERLVILSPEDTVTAKLLPMDFTAERGDERPVCPDDVGENIDETLAAVERRLIETALRDTGGIRQDAAEKLGISRHALARKMQRLGLDPS